MPFARNMRRWPIDLGHVPEQREPTDNKQAGSGTDPARATGWGNRKPSGRRSATRPPLSPRSSESSPRRSPPHSRILTLARAHPVGPRPRLDRSKPDGAVGMRTNKIWNCLITQRLVGSFQQNYRRASSLISCHDVLCFKIREVGAVSLALGNCRHVGGEGDCNSVEPIFFPEIRASASFEDELISPFALIAVTT